MADNLTKLYKTIFDKQKLINELSVIYHDTDFSTFSNIESMLTHFINNNIQTIFPEAFKLFTLIATIPVTSVSVGRHFSCLKRVKTYCRNSMTNDRLPSLALISIEKELFCSLQKADDFVDLINHKFVLTKDRRINLIYKT